MSLGDGKARRSVAGSHFNAIERFCPAGRSKVGSLHILPTSDKITRIQLHRSLGGTEHRATSKTSVPIRKETSIHKAGPLHRNTESGGTCDQGRRRESRNADDVRANVEVCDRKKFIMKGCSFGVIDACSCARSSDGSRMRQCDDATRRSGSGEPPCRSRTSRRAANASIPTFFFSIATTRRCSVAICSSF